MGERGPSKELADIPPSGWVQPEDYRLDWSHIEATIGHRLSPLAKKRISIAMRHKQIQRDVESGLPELNGKGRRSIDSQIKNMERELRETADPARQRFLEKRIPRLRAATRSRDVSPYANPGHIKRCMVQEVRRAVEAEMPIAVPSKRRVEGLTPFQRLIWELEIHQANSEDAFCAWLKEAAEY